MRELRTRVRWYIQDVRPARDPVLEAVVVSLAGFGLWAVRTGLVVLLGGGPM